MLEEIKELVHLINSLPQLALWVMIGFWAYKVIIVGSVYGLIRFTVDKLHSWLTKPKVVKQEWTWRTVYFADPEGVEGLMRQIANDLHPDSENGYRMIYTSDIKALREAWANRNTATK